MEESVLRSAAGYAGPLEKWDALVEGSLERWYVVQLLEDREDDRWLEVLAVSQALAVEDGHPANSSDLRAYRFVELPLTPEEPVRYLYASYATWANDYAEACARELRRRFDEGRTDAAGPPVGHAAGEGDATAPDPEVPRPA